MIVETWSADHRHERDDEQRQGGDEPDDDEQHRARGGVMPRRIEALARPG